MQSEFYNQRVVNWAKQNLAQPLEIKLRFASRWARTLLYSLLYLLPVLVIAGLIARKLTEGGDLNWMGVVLCGGVMLIPPSVIVLIGIVTQQKLVRSLDADGVKSSMGRRFLWQNLYFVDHISKTTRAGGVTRKTEDNQLELVFAEGKAIIPPLIQDRERIWSLINSAPAQVKFDGEIRATTQPQNAIRDVSANDFMRELERLAGQNKQNK
jgi:hypothetical protein